MVQPDQVVSAPPCPLKGTSGYTVGRSNKETGHVARDQTLQMGPVRALQRPPLAL